MKNHGGTAVARRTRTYKVRGFDFRFREKAGTTETRIFHVHTFTVVSVIGLLWFETHLQHNTDY